MSSPGPTVSARPEMTRLPPAAAPRTAVVQASPQGAVAVAPGSLPLVARIQEWIRVEGAWWATSFVFHMLLMCVGMLISAGAGGAPNHRRRGSGHPGDEGRGQAAPTQLEPFDPTGASLDPTELTTESLTWTKPGTGSPIDQKEILYDNSEVFEERGGGMASSATTGPTLGGIGGYDIKGIGPGPAIVGRGGVGIGVGDGTNPGSGGAGVGFGGRGKGHRKAMVAGGGGTRDSERAVAAALSWLARTKSPIIPTWDTGALASFRGCARARAARPRATPTPTAGLRPWPCCRSWRPAKPMRPKVPISRPFGEGCTG